MLGDKIRVDSEDKKSKISDKEGYIIFKSNFLLVFRNFDKNENYSIELLSGRVSISQKINNIIVIESNKNQNYLMWKDIKTGNNIRIHSENEHNGKEGLIVSNFSDKIKIYINEDEELELDLSQGIPPDSKIYDIEKIDSVLEEEIETHSKTSGFEIVEDIQLDDIMEAVPIPEEERLYSKQEEFNDMFEQLINKERPENINYLLENKLKKSIELFLKLKDETTLY